MNPLFSITVPLLLASESPRRRALLEQLSVPFSVQVSPADEVLDENVDPREAARRLATRKAGPVAQAHPNTLVLAADTVVIHEGAILEKPATPEEATSMLRRLSDDTHTVYTGLSVHHAASDREATRGRATEVEFGPLSAPEIEAYVDTRSPMDKAGGYGIQDHTGALFVADLRGDYYNVVGLPLRTLYDTLREDFGDLVDGPDAS